MSQYVFSAELPSAVLRSEWTLPRTLLACSADTRSPHRPNHLPRQFYPGNRDMVRQTPCPCSRGRRQRTDAVRSYATPPMLLNLSLRTAFVYGAFSIPICVAMWLYVPETKG